MITGTDATFCVGKINQIDDFLPECRPNQISQANLVITLGMILDKNTLDIQPGSFIPNERSDRGVRILAITLAFQAREAGSIPARRSNFFHR